MNMDYYLSLCERIKDHCRQKQWYGPDTPPPGEGDEYYEDGAFHLHVPLHDPHSGFAFPPATEEQLSRTEEVMGFSHSPCSERCISRLPMAVSGQGQASSVHLGGVKYGKKLSKNPV